MAAGLGGVQGGQAAVVIPPMQQVPGGNPQQPPPPLQPNTLNELGLVDTNWFKVVITKCPTGNCEQSQVSRVSSRHVTGITIALVSRGRPYSQHLEDIFMARVTLTN